MNIFTSIRCLIYQKVQNTTKKAVCLLHLTNVINVLLYWAKAGFIKPHMHTKYNKIYIKCLWFHLIKYLQKELIKRSMDDVKQTCQTCWYNFFFHQSSYSSTCEKKINIYICTTKPSKWDNFWQVYWSQHYLNSS